MPSHLGHGMHVPYLDRGPKAATPYHTLTNLPFRPLSKIEHRYDRIDRPASVCGPPTAPSTPDVSSTRQRCSSVDSMPPSPPPLPDPLSEESERRGGESGGEYAKFLRNLERTIDPNGFLDSRRYTHKAKANPAPRTNAPPATEFSFNFESASSSSPLPPSPERKSKRPLTAVALTNRAADDENAFRRRLRLIEDHMWQHKQEERELKRVEGDVNKSKREVLRAARQAENEMSRKMAEEERRLNETMQKQEKVRVEAVRETEQRTKSRIGKAHADLRHSRKSTRETFLTLSNAERLYRSKASELEMRRERMEQMSRDFESKLRRHESDQQRITAELADLSIRINMEAVKGKSRDHESRRAARLQAQRYIDENSAHERALRRKLDKTNGINRRAENGRRQASADLSGRRERFSERIREGERRVTDNKHLVERNIAAQKKLQESAEANELDKRRRAQARNVERHHHNRVGALERAQMARRRLATERGETWRERYETNRRHHAENKNKDLLKTFKRIVRADGEREQRLAKENRQQQHECESGFKTAAKLRHQLVRARAAVGRKQHEAVGELADEERQLAGKTRRADAKLASWRNRRTFTDSLLHQHRQVAHESKRIFDELDREHQRLAEIGEKTDQGGSGGFQQQVISAI